MDDAHSGGTYSPNVNNDAFPPAALVLIALISGNISSASRRLLVRYSSAKKIRNRISFAAAALLNHLEKMMLSKFHFATMAAVALSFADVVSARPGDVDTRFGTGGVSSILAPATVAPFWDPVTTDRTNRIISGVVGSSGSVLTAVNSDGTPDATFGKAGFVTLDRQYVADVKVDSKNRIVVATTDLLREEISVFRFLPDGMRDSSFGTDGVSRVENGDFAVAAAIAVDGSDSVFVTGTDFFSATGEDLLVVAKFDSAGRPEASFAGGVPVLQLMGTGREISGPNAIAIDHRGNIVVAGESLVGAHFSGLVVRLAPDGTLDPAFGDGKGYAATPLSLSPGTDYDVFFHSIAIDDQDRIVVAGGSGTADAGEFDLVAMRYLADGTLDPWFGGGGPLLLDDGAYASARASTAMIDQRGNIVITGVVQWTGLQPQLVTYRLLDDGTSDVSFGLGGRAYLRQTASNGRGALIGSDDILLFGISADKMSLFWERLIAY